MAMLRVSDGFTESLPGLGKNRGLASLVEKTITMQTRYALRRRRKGDSIVVSCSATFNGTEWSGRCWLNGSEFEYRIST